MSDDSLMNSMFSEIKNLPKEALSKFKDLLSALSEENDKELVVKQVRDIIPIKRWLNSSYYLGDMNKSLYPYWKEEVARFTEKGFNEWVITGAIGTGKSTAALVAVIRKIYELSCFDIPQRLFKLADVTKIYFIYFSINEIQAELTGFGQLRDTVDAIPYFTEHFLRSKKIDSILKFPRRISFLSGSDHAHIAGTNLLCAILDESNFYKAAGSSMVGDLNKATNMYAEVTDRRKSRFLSGGKDPGFSILVSSSTTEGSFTETRINNSDESVMITVAAPWDVKPKGTYSDKTFFVFRGVKTIDPFIADDVADVKMAARTEEELDSITQAYEKSLAFSEDKRLDVLIRHLPIELKEHFIRIPVDFKKSFDTHIYKALQNIAGVSTSPGGKLFTSRTSWEACISSELRHPFSKISIQVSLEQVGEIQDFFNTADFFTTQSSPREDDIRYPRRHPMEPRFFHVDQSTTTDCTGLVCVHKSGFLVEESSGLVQPVLELDFALRIVPPPKPDKIALAKIRRFIFWLRANNVKIGNVSYDKHQSTDSLQLFESHGISTSLVSTDANDKMWKAFINLLYEKRFFMYRYEPLEKEFYALNHDSIKSKVDHPKKNLDGTPGSKDVADGLVGAVHSCLASTSTKDVTVKDCLDCIEVSLAFEDDNFVETDWVLGSDGKKLLSKRALENLDIGIDFLNGPYGKGS